MELPIPPVEMRNLVGGLDPSFYDNPTGEPVFPEIPADRQDVVLDFGCGCGRLARKLIQQRIPPARYLGIDLHRGMVRWCQSNLSAPGFSFAHHDAYNPGLNPNGAATPLPLPDGPFGTIIAHSVFTHLVQDQVVHYLGEVARVLRPDGVMTATFFLFDKRAFPMMQSFQNALYINLDDPTNAVILDRMWLVETARELGLMVTAVTQPERRGYHWVLQLRPTQAQLVEAPIVEDSADVDSRPPPEMPAQAEHIGLSADA